MLSLNWPHFKIKGENMTLKTEWIRKSGELIASVTKGYSDGSATVRDRGGKILGHSSERFNSTRDSSGRLVSTNIASPGLLIPKK
jgi:hypothetical protein